MKKTLVTAFSAILALSLLTGCSAVPAASTSAGIVLTGAVLTTAAGGTSADTDTAAAVSDRDASGEYVENGAVTLMPGDDLTITEGGVYILSGSYDDAMLVVDANEEDKVQIVLKNAELSNENGPAIYVRSADKVFVTAAAGTENSISDGRDYTITEGDTVLDAAIFSREDLTINGTGRLTVSGNYKHAVVSKDDLVVTAKDLIISAEKAGLNGKDSVTISGASVSITAGSDGIRSDNDSDAEKGVVVMTNSSITIVSGDDGIQAETDFRAEATVISVKTGGGSNGKNSDAAESSKGINAGVSIMINGGSYAFDTSDDALHTNGTLLIRDGSFTIQSGDDGIHADGKAEIAGGTLDIAGREGIEATYVLISGGELTIQASDDGINAGRKSSAYSPTVEISGGKLTVTAGAGDTDCIDSNGDIIITGGTIYVNGSSGFDYDGSVRFTGGIVYVNGQEVSTISNQMMRGFGGQGAFPGGHGDFGGQGGFSGRNAYPEGMGDMDSLPGGHGQGRLPKMSA